MRGHCNRALVLTSLLALPVPLLLLGAEPRVAVADAATPDAGRIAVDDGTAIAAQGHGEVEPATGSPAGPAEVAADAPTDLSVTVYRSPLRAAGSIELDNLDGFALIRETRRVQIPPGESRIRFEGVADGIEAVSAMVSGLPAGLMERNLDTALLSPQALMAAAAGKALTLVRSNRRTGRTERVPVTVISGADGVVFQTPEGFEALNCSGLSDSFSFTRITGLSASPTLSVRMHASEPSTQVVTLSYLARGFDWSADYSATLSEDGRSLDLGAWVTLANSNGIGFPDAHAQVVAGRLNRESGEVEPFDMGGPLIARCWPQGSTSDAVQYLQLKRAIPLGFDVQMSRSAFAVPSPAAVLEEVAATGARVAQEQLGDLKLYRVPDRTTVASRQSKQVRLLDRQRIPVRRIYTAFVQASDDQEDDQPAAVLLRTRNDAAHHLGLPLPSGRIAVFGVRGQHSLLLSESAVRDLAENEEFDVALGLASDVQIRSMTEQTHVDPRRTRVIPLLPGTVSTRDALVHDAMRVEVSNAGKSAIEFELRLRLAEGTRVIRADHALGMKNGQPVFRLTIPANQAVVVRYQTATHAVQRVLE